MAMPDIDGCLVGGASLTADRYTPLSTHLLVPTNIYPKLPLLRLPNTNPLSLDLISTDIHPLIFLLLVNGSFVNE